MDTKGILAKAIEIVAFLFAGFSNFLYHMSPPNEGNPNFAVGISSFIALCILLYISAISKSLSRKKYKTTWLSIAGAFLVSLIILFPIYQKNYLRYTIHFPQNSSDVYYQGSELTTWAIDYMEENGKTLNEIIKDVGIHNRELIWTSESIHKGEMLLSINYIIVVISLATTIFCLTEGILVSEKQK